MDNRQWVRNLINEFGRITLIRAAKMQESGILIESICGDLGLAIEDANDCIDAGKTLLEMDAEQKHFENSIIEP